MDAPAFDPRLPPPVATLGVRQTRDARSEARKQAFTRAMQRAGSKATAPALSASADGGDGITCDADGHLHVDVLA